MRKKILYLDQFFFSNAFKKQDPRFTHAAALIREASSNQLLVAPFSSVHEDETHQWRGYNGNSKDDLMEFIKATSHGHEFEPAYKVEETQLVQAFSSFLKESEPKHKIDRTDAVPNSIDEWDDYFRIDVARYFGEIELMRDLKEQATEGLVDLFPDWRKSTNSFEEDVELEIREVAKGYIDSYARYASRVAGGDYSALFDSPIKSQVVQTLLHCLPRQMPPDDALSKLGEFFKSQHFREVPMTWISSRMFAVLKDQVKNGAYIQRDNAIKRHRGLFEDVNHISTYSPYCDTFVMDRVMASLVSDPRLAIEQRYNVRVFSLSNWDDFLEWLNQLNAGMTDEHLAGLRAAYP